MNRHPRYFLWTTLVVVSFFLACTGQEPPPPPKQSQACLQGRLSPPVKGVFFHPHALSEVPIIDGEESPSSWMPFYTVSESNWKLGLLTGGVLEGTTTKASDAEGMKWMREFRGPGQANLNIKRVALAIGADVSGDILVAEWERLGLLNFQSVELVFRRSEGVIVPNKVGTYSKVRPLVAPAWVKREDFADFDLNKGVPSKVTGDQPQWGAPESTLRFKECPELHALMAGFRFSHDEARLEHFDTLFNRADIMSGCTCDKGVLEAVRWRWRRGDATQHEDAVRLVYLNKRGETPVEVVVRPQETWEAVYPRVLEAKGPVKLVLAPPS